LNAIDSIQRSEGADPADSTEGGGGKQTYMHNHLSSIAVGDLAKEAEILSCQNPGNT